MQVLKKITITQDFSILETLKIFGTYDGLRLLIVNDLNNNFIGIITEPDIRRGLLSGLKLDDNISSIINKNPIIANIKDSKEYLLSLASQHNIHEIPLMDNNGKITQIISISSLLKTKHYQNNIVIMAGGLGTRLKPLTDTLPKPMLKVGSKPILQIILERFKQQGFRNITLCVNYKSHIIEEYFEDGSKFGLNINYVKEEKRMGTAGALSLIKNIGEHPFFVMNGDILTEIDFSKMLEYHQDQKSDITMGIREFHYQVPYGVVQTDKKGGIVSITEKPNLNFNVSAGIYLLNPSVIHLIPQDTFFDMPNLFNKILCEKRYNTSTYLVTDYWIDIGRHEEYNKANSDIEE
ncbi:alcohol dehydrogenase [Helicobacter anseris]|uniref:Alcohol dehydrogenase n=1 Tax=Helicobacter anseris TaxID=375926 RepID=A0A3D8J9F8_9HELI|nr:nucleotidyltransferase family protein [Helicobacter anseris]RDU73920.1 alcohol dehydrogenase [Helicobacter anseris]